MRARTVRLSFSPFGNGLTKRRSTQLSVRMRTAMANKARNGVKRSHVIRSEHESWATERDAHTRKKIHTMKSGTLILSLLSSENVSLISASSPLVICSFTGSSDNQLSFQKYWRV